MHSWLIWKRRLKYMKHLLFDHLQFNWRSLCRVWQENLKDMKVSKGTKKYRGYTRDKGRGIRYFNRAYFSNSTPTSTYYHVENWPLPTILKSILILIKAIYIFSSEGEPERSFLRFKWYSYLSSQSIRITSTPRQSTQIKITVCPPKVDSKSWNRVGRTRWKCHWYTETSQIKSCTWE